MNDSQYTPLSDELRGKYPSLMHRKPGTASQGQEWELENLRDGLQYYFDVNGRYPTSWEIDAFDFLPTARSIQRSFGGLVSLRTKLGLAGPTNFTKGEYRSKQAQEAILRAHSQEEEFYNFLTSKIPEFRVHEHKVLRPGGVSCDFFVYTKLNSGIAIDLFYAKDIHSVKSIVAIKTKKYLHFSFPVFYVLIGNETIRQEQLDTLVSNKKNSFPNQIKLINESSFKENFSSLIRIQE